MSEKPKSLVREIAPIAIGMLMAFIFDVNFAQQAFQSTLTSIEQSNYIAASDFGAALVLTALFAMTFLEKKRDKPKQEVLPTDVPVPTHESSKRRIIS